MIYCDTWALIYKFKLQCFETVLVTALHTNLKKKYVFGIDKACDSILVTLSLKRESLSSDGRLLQRVKRFLIRNSTPLT